MSAIPHFEALDRQKFSRFHLKTIVVAGIGFFTDALDIFVINLAIPMIAYIWYFDNTATDVTKAGKMPALTKSLLKASTQVGTLMGQLVFGYLGDKFGRKATYGVVLAIMIVATFGSSLSADTKASLSVGSMLIIWRLILGIGIGGDYPISAVIASEFAAVSTRGLMIAAVFAMQGLGILIGSICAVVVLAAMKPSLTVDHGTSLYQVNFDNVWRLLLFLGVIPALMSVYWRLQVPETPRFSAAKGDSEQAMADCAKVVSEFKNKSPPAPPLETLVTPDPPVAPQNNASNLVENLETQPEYPGFRQEKYSHITFRQLFSHWSNLKVLLGCSIAWFLLDVGFYGVQLNQSDILTYLGYGKGATAFDYFWSLAVGNLILSLCGTFPGYWFSVFLIEIMGRKNIQLMGFSILTIIFIILASLFNTLKGTVTFFILFTVANFFFNFGPNTTTFIIPAEIFPTQFRSTCHGISAATGKLGAIVAAFGFDQIRGPNGENMNVILWIFTACMLGGLLVTFILPEPKGKTLEELGDGFYPDDVVRHYASVPKSTNQEEVDRQT